LEGKINELVDSRLRQFETRLDHLSGRLTAVYGTYCQPSVGSELNSVHDTNGSHSRLIPSSVPPAMSKSQSNCRLYNNKGSNKHGVNGRAQAETDL
jgi:hypothetical protein